MDVNRLSQGQLIAAVSAVALFIFMFLPWFEPPLAGQVQETFGVDANEAAVGETESLNGWEGENPLDIYLLIVVLVAIGGALAAGGGGSLPIPAGAATALLGGIGTLLVLYQVFDVPGDLDRKFGLFLALIAVAGVAVGGYLAMQDEDVGAVGERY